MEMTDEQREDREEFERCADFHGHVCPGLAVGYRAAKAGMAWLRQHRAEDEEMVAVVETDACGVDAVQVLTGCTFGKGNLIHRDYGKQAFTLLDRTTGKGVRLALKGGALALDDEHRVLLRKIREGTATEEERETFRHRHRRKCDQILAAPFEMIFSLEPVDVEPPAGAIIEDSVPCEACGEPTMPSKMVESAGRRLCRGCL
ncbi:MAG: formylmethanofuran dehydrogenase [Deltaproteobacteria bacterium]|nr:formylmethanofuran dehydrogenase [Deltaproteobacteria bacterium]